MPRVFLSHSTRDRDFVSGELVPFLHKYGIDSWYVPIDIRTSDEWERKIVQGLRLCEWFLVVLSPNAVQSEWVKAEVRWAVENRSGRIIPLMLATCSLDDVHLRLGGIQRVDFQPTDGSGKAALLQTWGLHVSEIDGPPASLTPSKEKPSEKRLRIFTVGPHGSFGFLSWTTDREKARKEWDKFWAAKVGNLDVRANMNSDDYRRSYIDLLGSRAQVGREEPDHLKRKLESAKTGVLGGTKPINLEDLMRPGGWLEACRNVNTSRFDDFDNEGVGFKEIDESQLADYFPALPVTRKL